MKTLFVNACNYTIFIPFTVNGNVNVFYIFTPFTRIYSATSFTGHVSYECRDIVDIVN